ncbi:PPOX class F420-dependent oxidoreductase [Phycicoccus avicenniae]|uniref:PPOX class F420-dependent oxidoreductase n=1 Tax=Phycicoccus avicenniae TaxID=2828860 RepID=UPI003D28EADC
MTHADALRAIGDEQFVELTTFRRNGTPVATPVWVARGAGDSLVVTTPTGSGKVKRLRHTPRVELRPCSRRGTVPDGAPVVMARGEVDRSDTAVAAAHRVLAEKYRFQFRVVMAIERVLRRGRIDRVIVRLSPETP